MLLLGDLDSATIRGGQGEIGDSTARQATVRERAQARGLSAPTGRGSESGCSAGGGGHASEGSRAWRVERGHYASAHAIQMQLGKLCIFVSNCDEKRQFQVLNRTNWQIDL
eukprot:56173-Pleurochrysis_carterae.AAC.1